MPAPLIPMNKRNQQNKWGDAELDRLWMAMYEAEKKMDDLDLATDSPKLKAWEALNIKFRARMEIVDAGRVSTHATRT